MQRYINLYKRLYVVLIILAGTAFSPVSASFRSTGAARTDASYSILTVHSGTYAPQNGRAELPAYRFHSTSPYTSVVGEAVFTPLADAPSGVAPAPLADQAPAAGGPRGRLYRDGWDDDDNEIGVVDDLAPVGSPLILLAFALLYLIYRKVSSRGTFFCRNA